jgi:hypothetical protein
MVWNAFSKSSDASLDLAIRLNLRFLLLHFVYFALAVLLLGSLEAAS